MELDDAWVLFSLVIHGSCFLAMLSCFSVSAAFPGVQFSSWGGWRPA
jgi:hypothetical protein